MEVESKIKKTRIDADPFNQLHPDIFDLIFQHFRGADVLSSSEVSHLWFEATEASVRCGDKIRLKLSGRIDQLALSKRKYCNIGLRLVDIPHVLNIMKGRKWKNIHIRDIVFKNEIRSFLDLIEQTVEVLHIENSVLLHVEDVEERIFPKLIELRMKSVDGRIFEHCRSLKSLSIEKSNEQQSYDKVLTNNTKLEFLEVKGLDGSLRTELIDEFKFKLKRFDALGHRDFADDTCISTFLQSQSNSLEKLKFGFKLNSRILGFVLTMPKINELCFAPHFDIINENLILNWLLPQSSSITKLRLSCSLNPRNLSKLLDALPNLLFLELNTIHHNLLQQIGRRCQNLEELEVEEFISYDIDDSRLFPNIKRVNFRTINEQVKERIRRKTREERTSFEQAVLEGWSRLNNLV